MTMEKHKYRLFSAECVLETLMPSSGAECQLQAVMPKTDTADFTWGYTSEPCAFLKDWGWAQFFAFSLGRKLI